MRRDYEERTRGLLLEVVTELLETAGYDAVQLREVARRARLSLATIYELYPSRDELIVSALERWMEANAYGELDEPKPGEPIYDTLMRGIRAVFDPWARSPRMLQAYHRARNAPGGERLHLQGQAAVEPAARAALENADPVYVRDVELILLPVVYGLIGMFTEGHMPMSEILPTLERAVYRLTADNTAANTAGGRRSGRRATAS